MITQNAEMQTNDREESEADELALLSAIILVKRRRTQCYPVPENLLDLVDRLIEAATETPEQ